MRIKKWIWLLRVSECSTPRETSFWKVRFETVHICVFVVSPSRWIPLNSFCACLGRFADLRKNRFRIFWACHIYEIAPLAWLWPLFGSLGPPWAPLGCPLPTSSSIFTVCDACAQNQASWNAPLEPGDLQEPRKCQMLLHLFRSIWINDSSLQWLCA